MTPRQTHAPLRRRRSQAPGPVHPLVGSQSDLNMFDPVGVADTVAPQLPARRSVGFDELESFRPTPVHRFSRGRRAGSRALQSQDAVPEREPEFATDSLNGQYYIHLSTLKNPECRYRRGRGRERKHVNHLRSYPERKQAAARFRPCLSLRKWMKYHP